METSQGILAAGFKQVGEGFFNWEKLEIAILAQLLFFSMNSRRQQINLSQPFSILSMSAGFVFLSGNLLV